MPWSQTDLDALDNAIASGAKKVAYQTGSVEYHTLDEMLRLRDAMKSEVSPATAPARTSFVEFSRE